MSRDRKILLAAGVIVLLTFIFACHRDLEELYAKIPGCFPGIGMIADNQRDLTGQLAAFLPKE